MHNNKLLTFLSALSEAQLKEFRISYIHKRFSKDTVSRRLLHYLQKYHPDFPAEKLSAKKIHSFVFQKAAFNRDHITNAFSDLRKELKRFLIWKYQDDFPFERDMILLQLFEKFKLKKHFDQQLKSMKKELEGAPGDIWHWSKKMRIAHEFYFDPKKEQKVLENNALSNALQQLDDFHAIAKLKYACEFYNRQQVLQTPVPDVFLLTEVAQSIGPDHSILHQCFALSLQLLQHREEKIFLILRQKVLENIHLFSAENSQILITYLLNHIAYKSKNGKKVYPEKLLTLYQYGVAYEAFLVDGIFNEDIFNNIVELCCQLKVFPWLESFIDQWSPKLKADSQMDTMQISKSLLHFGRQNFEETIRILRSNDAKGTYNKLRAKLLYIAANFETDTPPDVIVNLCIAAESFARRNKSIKPRMKTGLLNFCKTIRQLLTAQPDKEALKIIVGNYKNVFFRHWLIEKCS